mmetsp:Transcript_29937/g.33415  ORF Transcript_29937/g.33415 Transcript_29937/m.33415 type:complete len:524 (+) Transcript_29937:58-1629(+)
MQTIKHIDTTRLAACRYQMHSVPSQSAKAMDYVQALFDRDAQQQQRTTRNFPPLPEPKEVPPTTTEPHSSPKSSRKASKSYRKRIRVRTNSLLHVTEKQKSKKVSKRLSLGPQYFVHNKSAPTRKQRTSAPELLMKAKHNYRGLNSSSSSADSAKENTSRVSTIRNKFNARSTPTSLSDPLSRVSQSPKRIKKSASKGARKGRSRSYTPRPQFSFDTRAKSASGHSHPQKPTFHRKRFKEEAAVRYTFELAEEHCQRISATWSCIEAMDNLEDPALSGVYRFSDVCIETMQILDVNMCRFFSQGSTHQARDLMKIMRALTKYFDKKETLAKLFLQMGERHCIYGVEPKQYGYLCTAIITGLETILGISFDAASNQAWEALFKEFTRLLVEGANRSRVETKQLCSICTQEFTRWSSKWREYYIVVNNDGVNVYRNRRAKKPKFTWPYNEISYIGSATLPVSSSKQDLCFEVVAEGEKFFVYPITKASADSNDAKESLSHEIAWRAAASQRDTSLLISSQRIEAL